MASQTNNVIPGPLPSSDHIPLVITEEVTRLKRRFLEKENVELKKNNTFALTVERYEDILNRLEILEKYHDIKKTSQNRKRLKRYELDIKSWEDVLIKRLVHPTTKKPYLKLGETFDIIHEAHINKGHVGRDSL